MENVAEFWADIEDDEDIVDAIVDDEIQELDQVDSSKPDDNDHNDDDEEDKIIVVFEKSCKVAKKKLAY